MEVMRLRISLSKTATAAVEADALVVGVFKEGLEESAAEVDGALGGWLKRLADHGEIKGESNETVIYHGEGRIGARLVVLVGLGAREDVNLERLREAAATGARAARDKGARRVAFPLIRTVGGEDTGKAGIAQATVEGAVLGLYRFEEFKSKPEEKRVEELLILTPDEGMAQHVERGRILAEATCRARDLANQPGNRLPPRLLGDAASAMGAAVGLEVRVYDERWMEKEGMGALLGVARGSAEPPRFIVMRYSSGRSDAPLLALVGKGLTFDSGGISIKPAQGMEEMKMDKAGGAAVVGAMEAIARLRPPIDVLGIVPASENLPGGRAQKPGDVVKAGNGKTIEVINTDAEGRLILADAVVYAAREGARWIIDIATLTGAVIIALGHEAAAVLGNDDDLVEELRTAGREVGERYWPLPTYEEFKEQYKSQIADIKNVGGRAAGTITAGMIIGEFVGDTLWAHLDIAGMAWDEKDRPYKPKGATGFGVRTLVRLAERLAAGTSS